MVANLQSLSCFETPRDSGLFILFQNQPPLHFKTVDAQLGTTEKESTFKKNLKKLGAKSNRLQQRDSVVRLM